MGKILYHTGVKLYPDQKLVKVFMVRDKAKLPKTLDVNLGTVMTTKKQWTKFKWVILANLRKNHPEIEPMRSIEII